MAVLLSPVGGVAGQFFDNNGNPLTGGKLYSYVAGTTTPQATYTSSAGTVAHSNPIILDAGGRVPGGEIWLTDGLQYKFVLKNANDVLIGTYDNIIGINSNFVNFLTETEVQTATAGQTVFTLTTMQYQPNTNNLTVYVDGVNQIDGVSYSYVETSSTVITFTAGLHVGALVKFTTAQTLSTGVTDASLVTYDPPFVNSVATTVENKLAQTVSVKDFGAVGNGVADDTVAIQAAIDSNAKQILGVAGETYRITSELLVYSSNIQLDFQNAVLLLDDATGLKSHIFVGDGTTKANGVKINNIVFSRAQIATSGYAIFVNFVGVTSIAGCRVFGDNKIYNGIGINKGIIINIENNYIQNCVNNGIYLVGTGVGADTTIDITIYQNRVEGGVIGLSSWNYVEGVFCRNNIFFNQSLVCVSVSAASTLAGLSSFKFQQNDFDTAAGGFFVDNVDSMQISENWFSNLSSYGIQLKENVVNAQLQNNLMYPIGGAYGAAIFGTNILVSGNRVAGTGEGVQVKSTAVRTSIFGNKLSGTTAIVIDSSASYTTVIGNDLNGNSVGTINGTGTNGYLIRNAGVPNTINVLTVTGSPFTYVNGAYAAVFYIYGGTVSSVTVDGAEVATASNCQITASPTQTLVITYSSVPTVKRILQS